MPKGQRQARPGAPRWWRWASCALALTVSTLFAGSALPADSIAIVLSGDGPPYSTVDGAIEAYFREKARRHPDLLHAPLPADTSAPPPALNQAMLVVTVGTRATAWALENPPGPPVLAVLVPRDTYARLSGKRQVESSAIYLDQPPRRRIDLMSLVLPDSRDVALLGHPSNTDRIVHLRQLLESRGYRVHVGDVKAETRLISTLEKLLEQSQVLFATPDPAIYNRNTIKPILLTAYRYQVPIIGFSRAYVRAGALAATYSTTTQIGLQAGEWIEAFLKQGHLPPPAYPRYFSVSVNRQVARALGLDLPADHRLLKALEEMEETQP